MLGVSTAATEGVFVFAFSEWAHDRGMYFRDCVYFLERCFVVSCRWKLFLVFYFSLSRGNSSVQGRNASCPSACLEIQPVRLDLYSS